MTTRIRVLVVDDHPVVRAGLATLLDGEPDMQVVGAAANAEEAVEKFAALMPDVTLMDLRLSNTSGIELTERLRGRWPAARIIMFTSFHREEEVYAALRAGVLSYVRKGAPAADLLEAIRVVNAGGRRIAPEVGAQMAEHLSCDDLSEREREVLERMFEGRSNREIGDSLDISVHTVNIHVRNLMSKLGAHRRTEAIVIALRKGLLRID
jgi:two-component system NarL family response regulator